MIDLEKKLIFIHIPKCGGSSIEVVLTGHMELGGHEVIDRDLFRSKPELKSFFPMPCGRHCSFSEYESWLKQKGLNPEEFTYFAVIRHPVTLFYSQLGFRRKMHATWGSHHGPIRRYISKWFSSSAYMLFIFVLIRKFLFSMGKKRYGRFVPFYNFFLKSAQSTNMPVHLFRLEDIAEDPGELIAFLRRNGYSHVEINKHNKSGSSGMPRSRILGLLLNLVFYSDIKCWKNTKPI